MTTPTLKTGLQRSRLLRLVVAVLVLVPLVVSAIYMWVLWDPTKTVKYMPVAVVNQDVGFTDSSGETNAGANVAANLVKSGSLDFQVVDKETAYRGLNEDDFYFVIDIPKDFSESLKTITKPEAAPALISVTFNDNNTLKASSIGASAMEKIYASVLKGVSSTTTGALVDGTQKLADGLRTAADGSQQLADGTNQLAEGTSTLSTGVTNDLAPGVGRARDGSAKLAEGAGTLSDGLLTLQTGTDTLGAGATELADGIERLTSQIPLAEVNRLLDQAQAVVPNSSALETVKELVSGLDRMQTGSREIATQLTDPNAQYRSGVDRLAAGGVELRNGAGELATGMVTLDAGVAKLADGATQLNDGALRLQDGAGQLATGLTEGAEAAPDFGDEEARMSLAALLSTPLAKEHTNLAQAQFSGPGGAPTILLIASMLVPIVVFLSFRGQRFVSDEETPRTLADVGRRAVAVSGISLAAMAVVGVLAWVTRDPLPDPAHMWQVVLITIAATLMNVALVSVLYTLFGYIVGTLASISWLMLQLFSYGGIWMIQTVPAPFKWLNPISPLTYVRDGYMAAFNGVDGFWSSMVILIVIGLIGLAVTLWAAGIQRRRYDKAHEEIARAEAAQTAALAGVAD